MCEHLIGLDNELKVKNIKETFRGQSWTDNCREWAYYDCVFDLEKIRKRFKFPEFIKIHINDDCKSGMEAGFYCDLCKDGIMGAHPCFGQGKIIID